MACSRSVTRINAQRFRALLKGCLPATPFSVLDRSKFQFARVHYLDCLAINISHRRFAYPPSSPVPHSHSTLESHYARPHAVLLFLFLSFSRYCSVSDFLFLSHTRVHTTCPSCTLTIYALAHSADTPHAVVPNPRRIVLPSNLLPPS